MDWIIRLAWEHCCLLSYIWRGCSLVVTPFIRLRSKNDTHYNECHHYQNNAP